MTHCTRWFLPLSWLLWTLLWLASPAWAACPAGYPRTTPNSDFTAAGNGMVQHTPTGLIWKRCAEGQSWDGTTCAGTAAEYTWQQAFERVDAVNAVAAGTENLGQTDWRVPNINELQSLVEEGCTNPTINLTEFPKTPESGFWSASPVAGYSDYAWYVHFNGGLDGWGRRSVVGHVRLVRAGQSFLNFDAALGTVTVSKAAITGTAAGNVPAATAFPIALTCGDTTLGPINATTAAPAQFINVPSGDCTVAEGTLPTITGVSWGSPSYSPANPITVTAGTTTAVTVTNTANVTTYAITATAGTGGSISPASQTVNYRATTTFKVTPDAGYTAVVSGCGGSLVGTTYTTGPITTACTVTASFSPAAQKTYTGATATGTGNATATVTGGGDTCGFSDARFVPLSSVADAPPAEYSFPHGLFKFTLSQCTVGSTITLSIRYPTALPETTHYWKYGPTANQAAHWYTLSQAAINGDTVTFSLTDGGFGDNDLKADGTISDPNGPGIPNSAGVVADIPTLSEWVMLILLSILLGVGGWQLRRKSA